MLLPAGHERGSAGFTMGLVALRLVPIRNKLYYPKQKSVFTKFDLLRKGFHLFSAFF